MGRVLEVVGTRVGAENRATFLSLTSAVWTSFVENHPAATPFHHPAWAQVLATTYGFDAAGLALLGADGEIEVALPIIRLGLPGLRRRWISLPFTDWCPPLVQSGTDVSGLSERLDAVRAEHRVGSLEVRDRLPGDAGERTARGYHHVVSLQPDLSAVSARFDHSRVARKLHRVQRVDLSVRRSDSRSELLEAFYPLHVRTRRRLGVPVQPRRFFEVLWQEFINRGLGFVVTARVSGVPVASSVFFTWNGRMLHKFAASDRGLVGNTGAGHAVVWRALQSGCETGHVEFDFGRTDFGNVGLRTFKRSWGARESALVYTVLGPRRPRSPGGRGQAILGPVIRSSPELVTRAIGRVGYRYTA